MARTDADRAYDYYPAFLDLRRKHAVVVGGGQAAADKVQGLLPCGPEPLVVIAPVVRRSVRDSAERGELQWIQREYQRGDLAGVDICMAVSEDRALNARVAAEARERRVPVLAMDDVPNCDFIAPAVVKRGRLTLAVSTAGLSPALASYVRRRLETQYPEQWGDLLQVASAMRDELGASRALVPAEAWQEALQGEVSELVWRGELEAAQQLLRAQLEARLDG